MILRKIFCTGRGQQIRTVWNVMVRPRRPCNIFMINAAVVPVVLQLEKQNMIWLLKCCLAIDSPGSTGTSMSTFYSLAVLRVC